MDVCIHVWMWELDPKEGWVLKNWCFWTAVLKKTHESPLNCKEIKPDNPKGNQPWVFIGRTDAKLQCFGHLRQRTDWLEKILMLGKNEGKRRGWWRMVGCYHHFNGMILHKLWEIVKEREAWFAAVHGITKSGTQLSQQPTTEQDKTELPHGNQRVAPKQCLGVTNDERICVIAKLSEAMTRMIFQLNKILDQLLKFEVRLLTSKMWCLSMPTVTQQATVHGVAKSRTRLSEEHTHCCSIKNISSLCFTFGVWFFGFSIT